MKALSIRAPWWWWILHGGKDIENRDWLTRYRGEVLIHASKWWAAYQIQEDWWDCEAIAARRHRLTPEMSRRMAESGGCVVGSVRIVDCVAESRSPWFTGIYGFVLADPVAFDTPIACKGRLGFFDVPNPLLDEVHRAREAQA